MIMLKILRFILPPFHPWKYKWINYWFGPQHGGYFITDDKFTATLLETDEYIKNKKEENEKIKKFYYRSYFYSSRSLRNK